jgi:hypothetical protein
MRTFLIGFFISIALAATSQDHRMTTALSVSSVSDFSSLEPFVRGLAMSNREVTAYRVRVANLPTHRYPKPVVIVWTREGTVIEQKESEASTTRKVRIGQIDVYRSGTTHSLRAVKGSMHFTLIELKQSLRNPKELPSKPEVCGHIVEFPEGGFACLLEMAPNQQVSIPELDVNTFSIAIDSGRVRNTIGRSQPWEMHYREGKVGYHVGYEPFTIQNLERKPLQFRSDRSAARRI